MNAAMLRAGLDNPCAKDLLRCRYSWHTTSVAHSRVSSKALSWFRVNKGVSTITLTYARQGSRTGSTFRSRAGMTSWSKSRSRKDVE
jgi:hypothetical protein